jgi:hypothetical protein
MPTPSPSFTFTTIDAPGATWTITQAINDRGAIAGTYVDSRGDKHPFPATPQGGEATVSGFGELLSAHARLGGMRSVLPGVPGTNGGSLAVCERVRHDGSYSRHPGALHLVSGHSKRPRGDAGNATRLIRSGGLRIVPLIPGLDCAFAL